MTNHGSAKVGPDVDIGIHLLALEWSLAGVAAIILGLRLYTVAAVLRRIRIADWLMVMAFVCAVVQGALLTEAHRWGLGRHYYYLNAEEQVYSMKYIVYLMGWGIASPMCGRISFCLFLLSFVPSRKWIYWSLWFFISTQAIVNLFLIVIVYIQCGTDLEALWHRSPASHCWSPLVQRDVSYFQCAWNSLTDLYLTLLPALLLKDLSIDFTKKLAVTFLLSLSGFAFVTSVVKVYMIKELTERGDLTWRLVKMHYWAVTENYIVIIAASVPLLNALLRLRRQSVGDADEIRMSASRIGSAMYMERPRAWSRIDHPQRPTENEIKDEIVVITGPSEGQSIGDEKKHVGVL